MRLERVLVGPPTTVVRR